jgi:hypothetical protein
MRVRDLIAYHDIIWPPPVVGRMEHGRRAETSEGFRAAVLRSVQWTDRDGEASIGMWLVYAGKAVNPASIPCPNAKAAVYRKLYCALEEGLGESMGVIEDTELRPER